MQPKNMNNEVVLSSTFYRYDTTMKQQKQFLKCHGNWSEGNKKVPQKDIVSPITVTLITKSISTSLPNKTYQCSSLFCYTGTFH